MEGENYFSTGFEGSPGYPLKFGHINHNSGGNEHFPGVLDEISIYDIALDQEEIQSQMEEELTGLEDGLVGYWNFNNADGDVLNDQTGNGNDGQINGASWVIGAPLNPANPIYGCNDPYAENFDPDANTNDGSCEYSQEPVTFTKEDYADPSLAENQDRITNNVWITRANNQPLYNAALEQYYEDQDISPEGTIWAPGFTAFQASTDNYLSLIHI